MSAHSGCRNLFIGFESLSQDGLKGWNKGFNRVKDYTLAVNRIHARGISLCGAIVFGNDCDTKEIFPQTLSYLLEANIDALQATILTPFPGTPLLAEMESKGQIVDSHWGHYNFRHVVFEPKNLSQQELKRGQDWVLKNFYSNRSIARRTRNELRYLSPATILRATLPLNLSYRSRLVTDGTFADG
jgi:radical SAM superfamily enzyme YgiQ (UPF0313 family)